MVCQGPIHPKTRPRMIHFMSLLESERGDLTGNEGHRCIETWDVVVHGCHLAGDAHTPLHDKGPVSRLCDVHQLIWSALSLKANSYELSTKTAISSQPLCRLTRPAYCTSTTGAHTCP